MNRISLAVFVAAAFVLCGAVTASGAPPALPTREDPFIKEVAALPAEGQVQRVMAKMKQMNRGFMATETHVIEDEKVTAFSLKMASTLSDISAFRALVNVRKLECAGKATEFSAVDLRPLRGLPLLELRLTNLTLNDLRPLIGMPLQVLTLDLCRGSFDLSPLKGMQLKRVTLWSVPVSSLAPLAGMRIEWLNCSLSKVRDLSPLKGAPLTELYCDNADVNDLSVLEGMPLRVLRCDLKAAKRNAKVLQSIATLEKINNIPAPEFLKTVKGR